MDHGKSILLAGGVALLLGALSPWPRAALVAQTATPAGAAAALDYETFRTKVQPILTAPRKGNARCAACHANAGGNAFLEPLTPGSAAYTEEQSRRNFERVSRLVVPGDPLKSRLLINPLATDAGGSHWHGGGKHWLSQDNAEWQTLAGWVRTPPAGTTSVPTAASVPAAASMPAAASSSPGLSFDVFRTKVQPILTSPRKGNARCSACHSRAGGNAYLEPLPPGSTTYTDEQSQRNFERVARLVVPGDPLKSALLITPLATDAGGSHWHGGGKHWQSQNDPE